jgi:hypothetical protein
MNTKVAVTVLKPRDDVERAWRASSEVAGLDAPQLRDAPGDRGTEIHVDGGGKVAREKVKGQLRRFKQQLETGEVARAEGSEDGVRQSPAQAAGAR